MKVCPYCKQEASGVGSAEDTIDWCFECDICIEGETIEGEEE